MTRWILALCGYARLEVCGVHPERVLNACAAAGIACTASEPVDAYTLRITVRARCAETAAELARRCQCEVKTLYRRGLPQLLQKGGVLVRWFRCGLRFRLLGRLGRSTAHHKGSGAVVDVGVGTKVTVGNGAFHCSTPLCGIDACGGKQLVQRDVVAVACDLVQQAFQLAGAVHPQAGPQCAGSANGRGQCREQIVEVRKVEQAVDQFLRTGKQEDSTQNGADHGNGLVPVLSALLFCGGAVSAAGGLGILLLPGGHLRRCGAEVGTIVCLRLRSSLFLFFGVFIDAF